MRSPVAGVTDEGELPAAIPAPRRGTARCRSARPVFGLSDTGRARPSEKSSPRAHGEGGRREKTRATRVAERSTTLTVLASTGADAPDRTRGRAPARRPRRASSSVLWVKTKSRAVIGHAVTPARLGTDVVRERERRPRREVDVRDEVRLPGEAGADLERPLSADGHNEARRRDVAVSSARENALRHGGSAQRARRRACRRASASAACRAARPETSEERDGDRDREG